MKGIKEDNKVKKSGMPDNHSVSNRHSVSVERWQYRGGLRDGMAHTQQSPAVNGALLLTICMMHIVRLR